MSGLGAKMWGGLLQRGQKGASLQKHGNMPGMSFTIRGSQRNTSILHWALIL
jgi:hypothetical protein